MGYSKEVYHLAQQELDRRRSKAQETAQRHYEEMESRFPRIREIARELSATGLQAAQAAISGREDITSFLNALQLKNQQLQKERATLLAQANVPADFLETHYTCSKCCDIGYIIHERCECMSRLLRRIAYQTVSDSGGMENCRFDNFLLSYYPTAAQPDGNVPARVMSKILQNCRDYAASFHPHSESLLFRGHTGLGKTHLSLSIAYEVIEKGYGVCYISSQRLLDKLQNQQFRRDSTDTTDYQQMVQSCDLLILDDLGAEFSTTFSVAALQNLINGRLSDNRPTIISTNFDSTLLKERYGERIVSRLLCAYQVYSFLGDDIRFCKRLQQANK